MNNTHKKNTMFHSNQSKSFQSCFPLCFPQLLLNLLNFWRNLYHSGAINIWNRNEYCYSSRSGNSYIIKISYIVHKISILLLTFAFQYMPNVSTPATYPEINPFINQDFVSLNLYLKPPIPAKMETIMADNWAWSAWTSR